MDVHAVARLRRVEQRRECHTPAFAPRHLAHDLAQHERPVGRRDALGRDDWYLELVRGVLGHEPLGLCPRLRKRPHGARREAPRPSLRLEREGQRRRLPAEQLELVLKARRRAQAELGLELLHSLAQERPRAALPRLPVDLGDVAED